MVKIVGLQYRASWNGTVGIVTGPSPFAQDEGKWQVSLRKVGPVSTGQPVTASLFPANIRVLEDHEAFAFGGHQSPESIREGEAVVWVTEAAAQAAAQALGMEKEGASSTWLRPASAAPALVASPADATDTDQMGYTAPATHRRQRTSTTPTGRGGSSTPAAGEW